MRYCPNCREGIIVNPSAHNVGTCSICGGLGLLVEDRLCACGRYAKYKKDKKWYCGRKECLEPPTPPPVHISRFRHGFNLGDGIFIPQGLSDEEEAQYFRDWHGV